MKERVLFVEEDYASIRYYLSELKESGFHVNHVRNTDAAAEEISKSGTTYALIILDSAIPPGRIYANEQTEAGTTTGQFLFRDIQAKLPNLPILILTNFDSLDWIRDAQLKQNVRMHRKLDTLPRELVRAIKEMIKQASVSG